MFFIASNSFFPLFNLFCLEQPMFLYKLLSKWNLPWSEVLLPPKHCECLNILGSNNLKVVDRNESSSINDKSKDKDFVASEVNKSN
jgi:hypothetical protein